MIVICLEGCHGSGKTRLCNQFQMAGFETLDEAFIDMPSYDLHPQSLTMEAAWVSHWFMRLLEVHKQRESQGGAERVYIADRSPFSAVFYARSGGHLLEPLIRAQIEELEKHNIRIFTVYIRVEPELLWQRIQARLRAQPERVKYNEGSREWMQKTVDFYESRDSSWDFIMNNNHNTLDELMGTLIAELSTTVSSFRALCPSESVSPTVKA